MTSTDATPHAPLLSDLTTLRVGGPARSLVRASSEAELVDAVRAADPALSGRALLAEIAHRRGMANPEHDITDPYRRGPEAARNASDQIGALLDLVLPALAGTRKP